MAKVKPENYKEKVENGLYGLVKVSKDGKEKEVLRCTNLVCKAAKCYGKTYIMYMRAYNNEENVIELQNHNGSVRFEQNIYNIMFGNKCIYALIEKNNNEDLRWVLVNKDLEIEKEVGDINVPDYYLEDTVYIKDNKERLEVTNDEDNKFWLELSSGDLEPVTKRHREKRVESLIEPDFYTVVIDKQKNSISMCTDKRIVRRNNFKDIERYIDKIAELIELDYETEESEGNTVYTFWGVENKVSNKLFSMIDKIGNYENLKIIDYMTEMNNSKSGLELLDAIIEELNNGFTPLELDRKYGIKIYTFNDIILTVIKNEFDRVASYEYKVGKNLDIVSLDTIRELGLMYKKVNKKCIRFKVEVEKEHNIQDNEKSKFELPYSIINNKREKTAVKEWNYGCCKEFELRLSTDEVKGNIKLKIRVCSDFNYKPKQARNAKNIVYRTRLNKVLVEIC